VPQHKPQKKNKYTMSNVSNGTTARQQNGTAREEERVASSVAKEGGAVHC
jgi:hypothetical protein